MTIEQAKSRCSSVARPKLDALIVARKASLVRRKIARLAVRDKSESMNKPVPFGLDSAMALSDAACDLEYLVDLFFRTCVCCGDAEAWGGAEAHNALMRQCAEYLQLVRSGIENFISQLEVGTGETETTKKTEE